MSTARRRVLDAAVACFAAKGYAATTVADIEAAAGLTPGAGGTYRHFASKRAMLEAAIDEMVSVDDEVLAPSTTSLAQSARDGLAYLERHRDLVRVFYRDLDQFPELRERVIDRLVGGPYRAVAGRLARLAPDVDAEAVAAIMIGALVNFEVLEILAGPGRSGVGEDRLVAAWAGLFKLVIANGNDPTRSDAPDEPRAP